MEFSYITNRTIILFLVLLTAYPLIATDASSAEPNPIEAGKVKWLRDLDQSLLLSKQSNKPVLVLFQEIPGCLGCQKFGSEVLTHPLLIEAIEDEFHPVLVYNNRPGSKDEEWLKHYREPSWNFQVIRFLDDNGNDIIPRKDKIWSITALASRIITTLRKTDRQIPQYLNVVAIENDTKNLGLAAFAMSCFWTGEYSLGKIEGVVATEAGWYDNREVTLVTYHKNMISLDNLVSIAKKKRCAQQVYLPPGEELDDTYSQPKSLDLSYYRPASSGDQKKQLDSWPEILKISNLTPMQRTKINTDAPDNKREALKWLSPRQLSEYEEYK